MSDRRFWISYNMKTKSGDFAWGSLWVNLVREKVDAKTLVGWQEFIAESYDAESVIIMFYKELEG